MVSYHHPRNDYTLRRPGHYYRWQLDSLSYIDLSLLREYNIHTL